MIMQCRKPSVWAYTASKDCSTSGTPDPLSSSQTVFLKHHPMYVQVSWRSDAAPLHAAGWAGKLAGSFQELLQMLMPVHFHCHHVTHQNSRWISGSLSSDTRLIAGIMATAGILEHWSTSRLGFRGLRNVQKKGLFYSGVTMPLPPEVAFMLLVLDGLPHVRGCGCPDCCCFCCCCCWFHSCIEGVGVGAVASASERDGLVDEKHR